jgi:hypothetical protein
MKCNPSELSYIPTKTLKWVIELLELNSEGKFNEDIKSMVKDLKENTTPVIPVSNNEQ